MPKQRFCQILMLSLVVLLIMSATAIQACTCVPQEEGEQIFIMYTCPSDVEIEENETVTVEVAIMYDGKNETFKEDFVGRLEDGYAWTADSSDGGAVQLDDRPAGTDAKVYWIGGGYQEGDMWHLEYGASVDVVGDSAGNVVIAVKQLESPPYLFTIFEGGSGPCSIEITEPETPPAADCWDELWQIGDIEGGPMDNPRDEFNPVDTEEATLDFYVGTDTDIQFTGLSHYGLNAATTINIHFNAGMQFGGRLSFSWSPGASGDEVINVMLDSVNLGMLERAGSFDEDWWEGYERFIDSFDIGQLDDGDHTLTFEFSSGNGAVWDWIRLEEKVVCPE